MKIHVFRMMLMTIVFVVLLATSVFAVGFKDVDPGAYYAEAVEWAIEKGITNGTSDTSFSPEGSCTRAQIVTFLWRYTGSPDPKTKDCPFKDVPANLYYSKAVLWAVENGITAGTSDDQFSPESTCTRGQIVTFLYRYDGECAVNHTKSFQDVPDGAFFTDPVEWALSMKITSGVSTDQFAPGNNCTRAQVVTFLFRYEQSAPETTEWDGVSLLDFAEGTLTEDQIVSRMQPEIQSILSPWLDEDGYLTNKEELVDISGQTVYHWAEQLKNAGILESITYNEVGHTVGMFFPSGLCYLYIPNIRGFYSGPDAYYQVQSFDELSLLDYVVIGGVDIAKSEILLHPEIYGAEMSAQYISMTMDAYQSNCHGHPSLDELVNQLNNLDHSKTRVTLWRGHGNQFTVDGSNVAVFITRIKRTDELRHHSKWKTDFDNQYLVVSGDYVAVTAKFFEKYMGHADGGIFISGACESGHDYNGSAESYMGQVLLDKGFDAYMAPKGSVFTIYSDSIVGAVSTNLCTINENDPYGRRQTLGEALDNAEAEWGAHDIYGISFEIYGDRDVRLLPTWEEAYEKVILKEVPNYGSIVQLADLDLDYTPELLIGSRPGSGAFSMIESIWTFRDDIAQKVSIPDMDNFFLSLNGYTPYKNKYTGMHRIEGAYTLRAGAGNYSNCISVYNLFNNQASMETVFADQQSYNMLQNTEYHYYYQGTTKLQSKSAYDRAVNDWRSEWQKISKYAFASESFNMNPTQEKIREMIKTYNNN